MVQVMERTLQLGDIGGNENLMTLTLVLEAVELLPLTGHRRIVYSFPVFLIPACPRFSLFGWVDSSPAMGFCQVGAHPRSQQEETARSGGKEVDSKGCDHQAPSREYSPDKRPGCIQQ